MLQVLTLVLLVASSAEMRGQNTPNDTTGNFAGGYASLKPEQKALVFDWMKRFSETIQKQVDPEVAYDNLPLSIRTTFNADTHALLSTAVDRRVGCEVGIRNSDHRQVGDRAWRNPPAPGVTISSGSTCS